MRGGTNTRELLNVIGRKYLYRNISLDNIYCVFTNRHVFCFLKQSQIPVFSFLTVEISQYPKLPRASLATWSDA